jgi:hypothetical protein
VGRDGVNVVVVVVVGCPDRWGRYAVDLGGHPTRCPTWNWALCPRPNA